MKKRIFIIASIVIVFLLTMTSCIGKKYEIRFDTNGGSYIESQEVKKRKKVEKPDDPQKEGYTFLYWELDGKKYDFGQKVKKSFTLVAKWDALTFTIDYNTNGGINNSDNITKIKADEEFNLKKPTKVGYTFNGWYTEKEFETKVEKIEKGTINDSTFYAKFTPNKYTITYITNGGIVEEETQVVTYDSEYELYEITKLGYTFTGYTKDEEPFTNGVYQIADDITIEANFVINVYNITYELYNSTNDLSNPSTYTVEDEITLADPTKVGYTFNGWYTEKEFKTKVEKIDKGTTNNITLYANFTPNEYTITYITNGEIIKEEIVKYDEEITLSPTILYGDKEVVKWIINDFKYNPNTNIIYNYDYNINAIAVIAHASMEYTFTIFGDEATITGYNGIKENILLPEYVKQGNLYYSISGIASSAFSGRNSLKNIVISGSVTSIGQGAFSGCSSLESITLPFVGNKLNGTTNTHFGYIFGASSYSDNDDYVPTSLKEVIITGGTCIDDYAFYKCSSLTGITIPNSVTSIGYYAFYECSSLKSIVIPSSVISIDSHAFRGCSSLTIYCETKSKPSGWSSYWNYFNRPVYWGINFYEENGIQYVLNTETKEATISGYVGNDANIVINETIIVNDIEYSVRSIGEFAFDWCSSLENVYYNGTLEDWCQIEFSNSYSNPMCYAEHFYMKDSNNEYYEITSMTEIEIPDTITSIGNYQFYGFSYITKVIIPNSVTSIGEAAFEGCNNLESITLPFIGNTLNGTANTYFGYIFGASSFSYNKDYVPTSLREVIITGGTIIGNDAFYECSSLTSIVIPDSVISIDRYAFAYCSSLTKVIISNSVTSIGYYAFYECSSLTSIVIPDSVTSIGDAAFVDCSSLTNIEIPNSVTSIGESAFLGCSSLESITLPFVGNTLNGTKNTHFGYIFGASSYSKNDDFVPTSLKEVIISGGTSIGYAAFYGCSSLESVVIGDSVTSIGESAFYYCSSLESIVIPDSVTSIDDFAFFRCSSLTNIVIPDNVTSIGESAFYECSNLESITLPFVGNTLNGTSYRHFGYIFGATYSSENGDYVPTSLKEVVITGGSSIGSSAFSGCSSLERIVIPSSVTSIGYYAFSGCSSLTSITIPNGVTSIGGSTFYYCSSLTSITIPNSVTSIDDYAFEDCSSLTNIVIPSSVTSIGKSAFFGCNSLESITLPFVGNTLNGTTNTHFGYIFGALNKYYDGFKYDYEHDDYIPTSLKKVIITGKTDIDAWSFSGCSSLTNIVISDSVTSIGKSAFFGCSSLESITLPFVRNTLNGTTNTHFGYIFGASSYSYNDDYVPTSLKEVIIIGGTSIGEHAFYGCSSLESIVIPNSVTSIGESAFSGCSSLQYNLYDNAKYLGNDENPYILLVESINNDITTCKISSNTISIGTDAFSNCTNLLNIELENSVTSIGNYAFKDCSSLIDVYYKGTIEDWCSIKFSGYYSNPMYYAEHIYMKDSNNEYCEVTEIEIPNTVTTIGDYQFFSFDNVTSVEIPNGVTSIGQYAFYECSDLTSITIPNRVTSIGEFAFRECSSLTSITISNSVTTIGEYAFFGCSSLESITLPFVGNKLNGTINPHFGYIFGASSCSYNDDYVPTSLKEVIITGGTCIDDYAFYKCSSLTSITIPNSVTSIGSYAFYGCSSLTNIVIPDSVRSIGDSAFRECSDLISIVIPNSVTSIDDVAFLRCSSLENVYYNGTIENWCNIEFDNEYSNPIYYAEHLYIKDSNNEYYEVTELEIPNKITKLGDYQFYGFDNLTKVIISSSVTSIGYFVFGGCSSLESITLPFIGNTLNGTTNSHFGYIFGASSCKDNNTYVPTSLKKVIITGGTCIDDYAFSECSSLTSITIPNSITSIGYYAFYGCSSLTSITIPNSVTSIGEDAFRGCSSLESITLPFVGNTLNGTTNTHFGYIFGASSYSYNDNYVSTSLKEVIITGGTSIDDYAFSECSSLTNIEIPNSVTSIGESAFSGCSSLQYNLYDNAKYLGNDENPYILLVESINNDITTCKISSNTISIGTDAFSNCTNLLNIELENSVTSIRNYAFKDCSSLIDVYYKGTIEDWCNIEFSNYDSNPMYYAEHLYMKDSNNEYCEVTEIEIPNTVTTIGDYQFFSFDNITEVTISDVVSTIGNASFYNRDSLESITLPFIGNTLNGTTNSHFGYIFGASSYKDNNTYVPTSLKKVIITGGTCIDDYAFYKCSSLTSITIPNSVTSIGYYAFYGCSSLENVYYNGTIEDWFNIEFSDYGSNPMSYAKHIYMLDFNNEYYEVTEIEIPNKITKIGDYQFYGFDNLTKVIISSSVKSIGERAFSGCSSLTSITIPNGVTSIDDYAFECSSLTIYCEATFKPSGWSSVWNNYNRPVYWGINEANFYEENGIQYVLNVETKEATISRCIGNASEIVIKDTITINEVEYNVTSIGEYAFSRCSSLTSITIPNSVTSIGYYAFYGCSSLTIYCEATSKPSGWNDYWNYYNRPVIWEYNK